MLNECKSIISISSISNLDTSNITDMAQMFCMCKGLKNLPDKSMWDVSNVEDMPEMFTYYDILDFLIDF